KSSKSLELFNYSRQLLLSSQFVIIPAISIGSYSMPNIHAIALSAKPKPIVSGSGKMIWYGGLRQQRRNMKFLDSLNFDVSPTIT
ncbi:MAG: hypothetical protein M1438_07145, partial [Deltaproteobacteria bacterium]|nr:hypothetical protein [Deltaproteobacteria bacterium]